VAIIDKDLFRQVERELYNYQQNVRRLNERRESILHGSPYPSEGRSKGRISDPTATRGGRLADIEGSEQVRWIECIHDCLRVMPREYKMLVKYKYFDKLKWWQVADRLHISASLYYAWRENVVLQIVLAATQRGLIQPIKFQEKNTG